MDDTSFFVKMFDENQLEIIKTDINIFKNIFICFLLIF